MPAQLYTFIDNQDLTKKVLDELLNAYSSGTPAYVNVSPDKQCYMPTFDFCDEFTREPLMRLTFSTLAFSDHMEVNDLGLCLINKPVDVFFIEKLESEECDYKYRVGCDSDYEPNTVPSLQTFNSFGKTFSFVMDVEAISSEAVGKDIVGTTQKVSLSALPFSFDCFDSIDDVNKFLGFKNNNPIVGPNNLYQINGYSSKFTTYAGAISKYDDGSCLVGKITKTREVKIVFGKEVVPCKIVWFLTGFGEMPFPVCATYDDYDEYQVGKYVLMFAFVKADFGNRTINEKKGIA